MAEQKFVQYVVNSSVDVEVVSAGLPAQILKAGDIAVAAVQEQTQAALSDDKAALAKAEEKLAQAIDSLKSLASVQSQINTFSTELGK